MDRLDSLEHRSIWILRESRRHFDRLGMLWSIGKDSNALLWLTRKAFFGQVPFPFVHVDTGYKPPEMITFRDELAARFGLDLIVGTNAAARADGMGPERGRLTCCGALKTEGLRQTTERHNLKNLIVGIRRDEEGSRGKERVFSPRQSSSRWDVTDQPPEFWDHFDVPEDRDTEVRIHPLLEWTELDVWRYIEREDIPVCPLYFANAEGQRYRSLGCAPCNGSIASTATSVGEIIAELETTTVPERAGRAQDKVSPYALQKLRAQGYM